LFDCDLISTNNIATGMVRGGRKYAFNSPKIRFIHQALNYPPMPSISKKMFQKKKNHRQDGRLVVFLYILFRPPYSSKTARCSGHRGLEGENMEKQRRALPRVLRPTGGNPSVSGHFSNGPLCEPWLVGNVVLIAGG
jgi:hypothetical protein